MNKNLLIGIFFFVLSQITTWFQLNGQFLWKFFKEHTFIIAIFGIPISYFYIWATKYTVEGLNGAVWPSRFISFGIGMIVYAILIGIFFKEGLNIKTYISLLLAFILVFIQVYWK